MYNCNNIKNNKTYSLKMKQDLRMSKPKKHANKIEMVLAKDVNVGLKININHHHITLHKYIK